MGTSSNGILRKAVPVWMWLKETLPLESGSSSSSSQRPTFTDTGKIFSEDYPAYFPINCLLKQPSRLLSSSLPFLWVPCSKIWKLWTARVFTPCLNTSTSVFLLQSRDWRSLDCFHLPCLAPYALFHLRFCFLCNDLRDSCLPDIYEYRGHLRLLGYHFLRRMER